MGRLAAIFYPYLAAGAIVFAVVGVRYSLVPIVGYAVPFTPLYVAVTLVAIYHGAGPTVLAFLLGYLLSDYLFMAPRGSVLMTETLKQATGLPAFIANDAFCATLAELRHGAGRGCRYMALLTLGTGVGGGIAIENKVLRGPRQILGEVGHLVIEPGGPRCGCGNHGCLEALTGRQPICDRAILKLQQGRASRLADAVGADHEKIDPRLIADLAREGDLLCQEVMDEVGYYLGLAISNIIVLCDPDKVVLGGGISGAGETLFGSIRRTVRHVSRISRFDPDQIVAAALGNQAGMVGAGTLVWEHLG